MIGDIIIYIREKWKQFFCVHIYVPGGDRTGTGKFYNMVCKKCGRIKWD